jgi:hypothetical protein
VIKQVLQTAPSNLLEIDTLNGQIHKFQRQPEDLQSSSVLIRYIFVYFSAFFKAKLVIENNLICLTLTEWKMFQCVNSIRDGHITRSVRTLDLYDVWCQAFR